MKRFVLSLVAVLACAVMAGDAFAQCGSGRSSGCGVSSGGCNVGSGGCNVGSSGGCNVSRSSGCNVSRSAPATAILPPAASAQQETDALLKRAADQQTRAIKPKRVEFDRQSAFEFCANDRPPTTSKTLLASR